jgi:hypothetical protein
MSPKYKPSEVTFKYYLPEHEDELWMHIHASDMYTLIYEVDQVCRSFLKYGDEKIKDSSDLAEKIREMIHNNIDMDKIS